MLEELRRRPGRRSARCPTTPPPSCGPDRREPVPATPAASPRTTASDFTPPVHAPTGTALAAQLGDGSTPCGRPSGAHARAWGRGSRRALLSRYLAFPLWDGLIFPTVALSAAAAVHPDRRHAVQPAHRPRPAPAGRRQAKGRRHCTTSAAFAEAEWRENDYLWGRLDGVELLLRQLYDAGSAAPSATATAPPASGDDAVRSAGGQVLQAGLRAVLRSEEGLTRIAGLRRDLEKRIADLA